MRNNLDQELSERHGVELRLLQGRQLSVLEVYRAEQHHGYSRGSVEKHRVVIFNRNIHHRLGTVLLEVTSSQARQIHAGVTGESVDLLYRYWAACFAWAITVCGLRRQNRK